VAIPKLRLSVGAIGFVFIVATFGYIGFHSYIGWATAPAKTSAHVPTPAERALLNAALHPDYGPTVAIQDQTARQQDDGRIAAALTPEARQAWQNDKVGVANRMALLPDRYQISNKVASKLSPKQAPPQDDQSQPSHQ